MQEKGFQSQVTLKKTLIEFIWQRRVHIFNLGQRGDKVQSNLQKHQVQTQRACPGSRLSWAKAERLRAAPWRQDRAQGDTRLRPEGGEDQPSRTTEAARGDGTRCQRAKRPRQVRSALSNNHTGLGPTLDWKKGHETGVLLLRQGV